MKLTLKRNPTDWCMIEAYYDWLGKKLAFVMHEDCICDREWFEYLDDVGEITVEMRRVK